MTYRQAFVIAAWVVLFWAIMLVVCSISVARGELPEGMHQEAVVRIDTVYAPMRTTWTWWFDSVRLSDSLKGKR